MQHNSDPVSRRRLKVANRSFTSAHVNRHGRWNCNRKITTQRLHYNPRQKLWGYFPLLSCFCTDFASNQRFTFLNTTTSRLPHSIPLNKMDVKTRVYRHKNPKLSRGWGRVVDLQSSCMKGKLSQHSDLDCSLNDFTIPGCLGITKVSTLFFFLLPVGPRPVRIQKIFTPIN